MAKSLAPFLIGVDGGGTSCRFALSRDGRRLEYRLGGANVATDREAAISTLLSGLQGVAEMAELSIADIGSGTAYLGLAGVMGRADSDAVASALPFERVVVDDDQKTAVTGALGGADGSVASIGTGSFVARKTAGQIRSIGGWGLVLTDEASGAWLGRGALRETLRAFDGLVVHSDLTRAILAEHDGPSGIASLSMRASPAVFADLAPRVIEAARCGDSVALQLMHEGAAHIERALAALGWSPGERLCLVGGVGPCYAQYLPDAIKLAVARPRGSPLDGALALAARLNEGDL